MSVFVVSVLVLLLLLGVLVLLLLGFVVDDDELEGALLVLIEPLVSVLLLVLDELEGVVL